MIDLEVCGLLTTIYDMKVTGHRLVQMSCTKLKEGLELIYSFDLGDVLTHYRVQIEEGMCIPSISTFYVAAFLYENEIHDLFGVYFKHITIDYKGNLYKLAVKTPFNPEGLQKGEVSHE